MRMLVAAFLTAQLLGAPSAFGQSAVPTVTPPRDKNCSELTRSGVSVYVASPLGFTASTRAFMYEKLIPAIQQAGVNPVNPWDSGPDVEKKIVAVKRVTNLDERRAEWKKIVDMLGQANARSIECVDGIVAVLEGVDVDSGTAAEIGYGAALNKWIIGYREDLRHTGEDETAEVNLQVEFFIRASNGVIVHSLDELTKTLRVGQSERASPR